MANSPIIKVKHKNLVYHVRFLREPDWIANIIPTPLHHEDSHAIVKLAQDIYSNMPENKDNR